MKKQARKKAAKKKATAKKHIDTKSHNISVKIGAAGDYAKYEIGCIKALAKLLKQPYKKTLQTVNLDNNLLNIISANFAAKKTVKQTASELKAEILKINQTAKTPIQAFVDLLSKLPKKQQPKTSAASFPMKLPATVTIGNVFEDLRKYRDFLEVEISKIHRDMPLINDNIKENTKETRAHFVNVKNRLSKYLKTLQKNLREVNRDIERTK